MTDTIISSATKEVVIGFDRPFVIIGERINPTGRKILAAEMAAGNFSRVEADARAQVEAGAHMLDVNAGIPLADEPAILARAIQLVQSITDVPLSIDSSIVAALEAGLAVYKGKALVNSVTGEDERLEAVLPLIKKYGAAVIAISNDETGISEDPDVRFAVAKKIVERAMDYGIPACDVVVDPLVMPIGAINQAGVQVMRLVHRLRTELKVNTSCGASNISFGLPNRDGINSAFLTMAMGAGMTSAITNPLHVEVIKACMGADVMLGHDPDCARWIRRFREMPPPGSGRRRATLRAAGAKAAIAAVRLEARGRMATKRSARSYSRHPASAAISPSGTPLLQAARSLGVDIDSVCGGRGLCGRCQVLVAEGRVRQARGYLIERQPVAVQRAGKALLAASAAGGRPAPVVLGANVEADVVIDVPASSQVHRQVVRKEADARAIELNPVVRLHYVQVKQPDMHDPSGDLRRLFEALESEWGLKDLTCDLSVLQMLQPTLRDRRVAGHSGGARRASKSSASGPACTSVPMASRSTSARRPSPRTCAICAAARWSHRRAS